MDQAHLKLLLEQVKDGAVSVDDAIGRMKHMPFEDLGFAKVDHHRAIRHGMPEVIFGQGKAAVRSTSRHGVGGKAAGRCPT